MSRQNLGDKSLADILQDPEAGTPEDKLRLFIIYYICSQNSTKEEIDSLSAILEVTKQEFGPGGCALALYSQGWRSKIQRQREQLVTNKGLRMPVIGKGPDLDFISPADL